MKILHLSDLHIGGEDNLLEAQNSAGSSCTKRCEVIFDNIIADCKPTSDYIIVISGDVTDGGSALSSKGIQHQYEGKRQRKYTGGYWREALIKSGSIYCGSRLR